MRRVPTTAFLLISLLCHFLWTGMVSSQEVVEGEEEQSDQKLKKEEEKRMWGSQHPNNPETTSDAASKQGEEKMASSSSANENDNKNESKIPFVPKPGASASHQNIHHHGPPEGFRITSRVYTDPDDRLAHFDNDSQLIFPYWECGVSGSTTVPIPLQHATVRHLLGGSQPNLYSGDEFGPHPQLVIALTKLDVVLNSGQKQTFHPGDILLLEDVISGGHKLKGHDNQDMTVMILTLENHYHQVGKDKSSLSSLFSKSFKMNPCRTGMVLDGEHRPAGTFGDQLSRQIKKLQTRSVRRYMLTVIGLSVSVLVGDFLGKVAPLWLAVLFGGGCFVSGGTFATVKAGETALDQFEMWQERRQLRLAGYSSSGEGEEEQVETGGLKEGIRIPVPDDTD